jgi:hypothetical protein
LHNFLIKLVMDLFGTLFVMGLTYIVVRKFRKKTVYDKKLQKAFLKGWVCFFVYVMIMQFVFPSPS